MILIEKQQKYQHYHPEKFIAFEKQQQKMSSKKKKTEALKDLTEEKELESIEALFSKNMRTDEIKKEINEIKKWADKVKRKDLKHKTAKYKNDFQHFKQQDLLVKVFILVKLVYTKLIWIRSIY